MAEGRTLGDAIAMDSAAIAFINDGKPEPAAKPVGRPRKTRNRTTDIEMSKQSDVVADGASSRTPKSRRLQQHVESSRPTDRDILDEVLVPLTTRLPHRLVQSLRRICLEQRLRHAKPDSIQEIVETALESWLAKQNGR